jgi:glutamyl-tRNA synthetase
LKMGKVAQPLRVAVSGGAVSPPIDKTCWLIGRERVLARLQQAATFIRALPA